MSDCTLKVPLGGGFTLTRIVGSDGSVAISVANQQGTEIFSELVAGAGPVPGSVEPSAPEQAMP